MRKAAVDPARAQRVERGKRIAQARQAKGLSQSQLASKVGCEAQTLSKYERGVLSPGTRITFRIADECGVDPRWLAMVDADAAA
jgi:transcriptional regulator with XRE-family HTH domain